MRIKRKIQKQIEKNPLWQAGSMRIRNFRDVFWICAASMACGILLGVVVGMSHAREPAMVSGEGSRPGLFRQWFAPIVSVAGRQLDGRYVFSDFESSFEFALWEADAAHMEPSLEHAHEGGHSALVQFFGHSRMSGIRLEEYFKSRYAVTDWSPYHGLGLYVVNPSNERQRLILQVKDRWGRRFKKDLRLGPGEARDFIIPVSEMKERTNPAKVDEVSLFLWENRSDKEFYIDHIRLVPEV